jgi:hypothetical protein
MNTTNNSSSIDRISSYQLPVITSAESVVVSTDRTDDPTEMITIKRSTTIASGDFDIDDADVNNHESSNDTSSNAYGDNNNKSDLFPTPQSVSKVPSLFTHSNIFELLISLCLSLLLKSLFGSVYIIRTLFFGYIFNYCMKFVSVTENMKEQLWISPMQFNTAAVAATVMSTSVAISIEKGVVVGTNQSSSWPPPTLLALAILTIMALIVHPDGYTWITLYKLRYVSISTNVGPRTLRPTRTMAYTIQKVNRDCDD